MLGSARIAGRSIMSAENAVSVLICKDAGTAGRTLLARNDLRVRWALNIAEADSVIRLTKCAVCITRESLARKVLAACNDAGRSIATIVLLEPSSWSSWREYFEAGAMSVLQVNASEQLLDAMADATGLSFRTAPRIPFRTDVGFALGDEGGTWRSVNLSASGICLLDFPPYALGSEVDLAFELDHKRYEVNAIVSQILRHGGRRAVGLAFQEVSREVQAALDNVIHMEQRRARAVTDPVDEFDRLDESTFLALRSAAAHEDTLDLMRALTSAAKLPDTDKAAPWLIAACHALSALEVVAVRNPQAAPKWAQDALLARIRVYQARARAGDGPLGEKDVREVFGLCQRMADSAAGSDDSSLVQVTNVRAEILRAVYDQDLLLAADLI
jgi:hypothetical protein